MTHEFEKFASRNGISPITLNRYGTTVNSYINPSIIEEKVERGFYGCIQPPVDGPHHLPWRAD